jgi:nucleotide-binding universal stress UspA family protein
MEPSGTFRSILFPVDFSEACHAAAVHVRGFAELTGAHVTLLHVIPWLSAWYSHTELRAAVPGEAGLRGFEEAGVAALEAFRRKHFSNIPCGSDVRTGAVAETITDTAAAWGTDLIMMATRGLGRSRPFLIGSNTAKLLHDATCAVWTSPYLDSARPFRKYAHILCALDREDIPEGYVEEAIRLASNFQSKLTFLTAVPSTVGGCGEEHPVRSAGHEFPQAHLRNLNTPPDCAVLIETGAVGDVVRKAVETHNADLVLTNRGHIHQPFGRFRTHTYEIVLESPCPVLSLCIYAGSPQNIERDKVGTERTLHPAMA